MHKKVLVIGGGIAGVQASLDLADSGVEVYLVERAPSIGGRMAQLDKTFPTNDCAMCILSPKLVEAGNHPYINIITNAGVGPVTGEAPNFRVTVTRQPRYVNEKKCTGCGICMAKCPVKITDEYNKGLNKTRCIRIPFPQAVPAVAIIDKEHCIYHQRGKCRICEKFCEARAIDYDQKEEVMDLEVGSIILAAGVGEFNAALKDEYGYRTFPNVVTSIEFERLLSASGPTRGHILRPSDGKEPQRIAFIQCVGSRDIQVGNEHEHCSAICCMQAAKDAIILAEHLRDVQTSVFGMDIRAYGKNFDNFVERAEKEHGTRFIRSRISSVEIDPAQDNLVIQYAKNGRVQRESFDMLVLSIGLQSTPGLKALAAKMGLRLNDAGFIRTTTFSPVGTSRPGIFVCGTMSGPKDIPESVIEASAAASSARAMLTGLPAKEICIEYPAQKPVNDGDRPRIGVFVCNCGINIGATVKVKEVVDHAAGLPYVSHSEELLFACSQDSQKLIDEKIREFDLNRIIVAACTPRTHEPLFQNTLVKAGLNPYLFEFVNIREQCSWVHQQVPEAATGKAKELVAMAVRKAAYLEPLSNTRSGVNKNSLVIGAGLAGMTAALDLAAQGYHVELLEKEADLGGNLRHIAGTLEGEEVAPFLMSLIDQVAHDPNITVHTRSVVAEIRGFVGNFRTAIETRKNGQSETASIEHGVVIVATGAQEYAPTEYLYGQDGRVMTQRELEKWLAQDDLPDALARVRSIVMIQCVGSRSDEHPHCSRVCCSTAIKNGLRIKQLDPKIDVYILNRDVRSYGLKESYYRKAREAGVIFIHFDKGAEPVVARSDRGLSVLVKEEIIGRTLRLSPDLLVLSSGIVAPADNRTLSQMLKVPLGTDGFFLEAHVKLRPVDFATDGVFVCGLAHYPKDMSETIAQAKAAASRAVTILSKNEIEAEGKVAMVNETRCNGCGFCVEVCAYKAIELDPEKNVAVVVTALCKGCGTCAASCRPCAINLKGFRDEQILAALSAV